MSEDKRSLWIAVDFDGTLTSSDAAKAFIL